MSDLGNKEIMAKNIKKYMSLNDVTQTQICNTLNIKMSTFSDWVNAKTYPRIDKIELIANYFGIEKSDLVENREVDCQSIKIPVLGYVIAGLPIEAVENIIDYEEIPTEMARHGEFFGLKIKGHSMEPRICEGDIVIVKKQADVDSGDIAIVLVNGEKATCKKIIKIEAGINLVPLNTVGYDIKFYSNEQIIALPVTILGKVVELRGKF